MNKILTFICNFLFFSSCFFAWLKFNYSIRNFQKVQNNILKKLLDKGVILKIDSGKNIKYVVKK